MTNHSLPNNFDQYKIQVSQEIACFGRLPFQKGLIEYPATACTELGWQQWLMASYASLLAQYGSAFAKTFATMPAWQFMLVNSAQEAIMLGTLVSGCNSAAEPYPFSIFRQLPPPDQLQQFAYIPLIYQELLIAEKLLCVKGWESPSKQQFLADLGALKRTPCQLKYHAVPNLMHKVLNILNLGVMKQGLAERHAIVDFNQFLSTTHQALQQFFTQMEAGMPTGIKIPLPCNKLNTCFVVFWLQLIYKAARTPHTPPLWIFWNHAYLLIYYPQMEPQCFKHLIEPHQSHPGLVNYQILTQDRALETTQPSPANLRLAEQLSLSLLQTLEHWQF